MARLGRAAKGTQRGGKASPPAAPSTPVQPTGPGGLPLPSPIAGTNLVIADIVLRAAGGLLRNRMTKGLLVASYTTSEAGKAKAERLVDGRSIAASLALWGASRLATRSPAGLAVVAGGLAAKVLYDRGKQLEAKRRARKTKATATTPEV